MEPLLLLEQTIMTEMELTLVVYVYINTVHLVSWNQLGSDIDGDITDDHLGRSVSLSSDGTILAIGTEMTQMEVIGHVRVYKYS